MKSNRIACTTFALFLLLAGLTGVAGAAEPAAAPAPAPVELAALLSDAPGTACAGSAKAAPSEAESLAELIRSFTASYGNPEPIQKACVASAGGCQCVGSCSGSGGCFCSDGACCSTCCSQYRAQCC